VRGGAGGRLISCGRSLPSAVDIPGEWFKATVAAWVIEPEVERDESDEPPTVFLLSQSDRLTG